MGRLFVYDENMTDERAKITVAKMAAVSDIVASEKAFIQYSAAGQLTVLAGAVIAVGDAIFQTEETTLSAANLDGASSFAHGKDYYIYLCDNGKDSSNEVYLISENSTFPDGVEWDDTNTRKIGGFHYGFVRNVDEYGREVNTIGFKGIVKKIMVFVVIAVAYNVQRMTGDTIPLREIVIVFFICNEALSILENAAEFINIPQQLKDVLLQLRDKNAAKAEEKEESEE